MNIPEVFKSNHKNTNYFSIALYMTHHEHPFQKYQHTKPHAKTRKLVRNWDEEFRDTIGLLEEKLLNHVRLNGKLESSITNRFQLIEIVNNIIKVNLNTFNEDFFEKFIVHNPNAYCLLFIEQLEHLLIDYLNEARIENYTFRFSFKVSNIELEKSVELFLKK